MPWIFSMRPVDVGRLLLSAWQEEVLQRRHCLTKDWPYLQAALYPVGSTHVDLLKPVDIARWCDVGVCGACVAWNGRALSCWGGMLMCRA